MPTITGRISIVMVISAIVLGACASDVTGPTASDSDVSAPEESETSEQEAESSSDQEDAEAAAGEEAEEPLENDSEPVEEIELEEPAEPEAEAEPAEDTEPEGPPVERPEYDPAALEVVAELNQWRLSIGLWPFQPNDTLTEIAEQHIDYLMTLPAIPFGPDIHLGPSAEGPKDRAADVGWPSYNNPDQIAITEIAALNFDAQAAVGWWMGSKVHYDSVVNPAYRELGAAAREHPFGMLYIVVLGAQPDTLPALVDPLNAQLYVSSEQFVWASGGDWIQDVSEVQLLDAPETSPDAEAWIPFQTFLDVSNAEEEPFGVALSDGERELTVEVNPQLNIAWLPGNLTLNGPTADIAAAEEAAAEAEADQPEAPDVTIVYDEVTLLLVNTSSDPVDLTGLQFVSGDLIVPATLWDTDFITVPLTDIPAGDCLQLYDWNTSDPGITTDCGYRRSTVYVQPDQIFWATDDFQLRWSGELLTTCEVGAERCETNLP